MAVSGNVALHSPDDPAFESLLKNKKSDFSEAPWLYLIILIVLIAEQAMAVRLSFHTRSQEMAATFAATASTAAPAVAAPEPQELQPA
jgi:hypothetical protein